MNEFDLIERIRSRVARGGDCSDGRDDDRDDNRDDGRDHDRADHGVVLGIGDDAAVLQPRRGMQLVATVDQLVDGRHFEVGPVAQRLMAAWDGMVAGLDV